MKWANGVTGHLAGGGGLPAAQLGEPLHPHSPAWAGFLSPQALWRNASVPGGPSGSALCFCLLNPVGGWTGWLTQDPDRPPSDRTLDPSLLHPPSALPYLPIWRCSPRSGACLIPGRCLMKAFRTLELVSAIHFLLSLLPVSTDCSRAWLLGIQGAAWG